MSSDNDDVDKLLGQIKLEDFKYRAFGRGEPKPLRIVRTGKQDKAAEPVLRSTVVDAPAAAPAMAAASTPPARISAHVDEAFARLTRASLTTGAPSLRMRLELPLRPPLAPASVPQSAHSWQTIFERLQRAALLRSVTAQASSGRKE